VVARAEYVCDLIVAVAHYHLLEHYKVGLKLTKAVDEHRPTLVPHTASPHRFSVATRTSLVSDTLSIANLPGRSPLREHAA
jgi:hypothetical protein